MSGLYIKDDATPLEIMKAKVKMLVRHKPPHYEVRVAEEIYIATSGIHMDNYLQLTTRMERAMKENCQCKTMWDMLNIYSEELCAGFIQDMDNVGGKSYVDLVAQMDRFIWENFQMKHVKFQNQIAPILSDCGFATELKHR